MLVAKEYWYLVQVNKNEDEKKDKKTRGLPTTVVDPKPHRRLEPSNIRVPIMAQGERDKSG